MLSSMPALMLERCCATQKRSEKSQAASLFFKMPRKGRKVLEVWQSRKTCGNSSPLVPSRQPGQGASHERRDHEWRGCDERNNESFHRRIGGGEFARRGRGAIRSKANATIPLASRTHLAPVRNIFPGNAVFGWNRLYFQNLSGARARRPRPGDLRPGPDPGGIHRHLQRPGVAAIRRSLRCLLRCREKIQAIACSALARGGYVACGECAIRGYFSRSRAMACHPILSFERTGFLFA